MDNDFIFLAEFNNFIVKVGHYIIMLFVDKLSYQFLFLLYPASKN